MGTSSSSLIVLLRTDVSLLHVTKSTSPNEDGRGMQHFRRNSPRKLRENVHWGLLKCSGQEFKHMLTTILTLRVI